MEPRRLRLECPSCGSSLRADTGMLGREVLCPRCREVIRLPRRPEPADSVDFEDDDRPRRSRQGPGSGTAFGLGLTSFILGLIGLAIGIPAWIVGAPLSFCPCCIWIPFIPWPLSILGLIMGAVSMLLVYVQGKRNWGFPIAGTTVSLVGSIIPPIFLLFGIALWDQQSRVAGQRVQQLGKDIEKERERQQREQNIRWTDAGKDSLTVNGVRVRITAVERREAAHGFGEHLAVTLQVQNQDPVRRITYQGWGRRGQAVLALTDDRKRGLPCLYPRGEVPEQVRQAIVNPGELQKDVLFFRPPPRGFRFLRLTLPGRNLGMPGQDFHFQIPQAMIADKVPGRPEP